MPHGGDPGTVRPLCIVPFGDYGGSEMLLMRVLRALDGSFDPRLLVLTPGGFADMLADAGYPTQVLDLPGKAALARFPLVARHVAARYRGEGVSLIHANGIKAALLGIPVGRLLKVPIVWMKHDHVFDGRFARAVARGCDRVVVVSESMARQFDGPLRGRVSVIYPGVELGPPPQPHETGPVVVAFGRLDPLKGYALLLRATRVLRDRGVDARVRIAGPVDRVHAGHAAELQALAGELALGDAASVDVGWVDDLDDLYGRARVVAVTSPPGEDGRPTEGAPTVLLEAMAHGRPVVAARQAGTAEVIGDEAGTLVADVSPEGFADALAPYLEDRAHADAVGLRGRDRAERLFGIDRTVEQLTGIWREVAR